MTAETAPRKEGATGGNAERPEVGGSDEVQAEGLGMFDAQVAVFLTREDRVNPEGDERDPAGITMHRLEIIVVLSPECGMCAGEDETEHGEENVRCD